MENNDCDHRMIFRSSTNMLYRTGTKSKVIRVATRQVHRSARNKEAATAERLREQAGKEP
jgi:hypothetical protein